MRRIECDHLEFDPPGSEQSLSLAIASPSDQMPSLAELVSHCGASGTEGSGIPAEWPNWPKVSSHIEKFSGMGSLFKLRGDVLPLFTMNSKLGLKENSDNRKTVIVIRMKGVSFGVTVDDIIHQQQIVIKKLGQDLQNKKGLIGSAIMSDGKPALIVDLYELFGNDVKKSYSEDKFKTSAAA